MAGRRPIDAADLARVLHDPQLLAAFRVAFAGPDAEHALRRADDPDAAGATGGASPFTGIESARRRLFQPDATDLDRAIWRDLEGRRIAEHRRVDDAVGRVLADAGEIGPMPAAAQPSGRVGRRRLLIGAAALVSAVLVVSAAVAVGTIARRSPIPPAAVIEPPQLEGTTILTLVDRIEPGVTSTSTITWNSGYDPLQPDGFGLGIALRCRGVGRVVVRLTNGESFPFTCTETARTFIRRSPGAHPDALVAFVPTTGRVLWGLRIVKLPLER